MIEGLNMASQRGGGAAVAAAAAGAAVGSRGGGEIDWNSPDIRYQKSYQQDHERRAFAFVDECIYWLREQFFSSVPWYCHQSLVECILKVLSKATQSAKATYRRTVGGPQAEWNSHCVYVTVRFVKMAFHPRVHKLDLSNVGPKALRDELYKGLDHMSGLETLNLGSGNGPGGPAGASGTAGGEIIRKRIFMSFKYLRNLKSLTFTNECQNETLAVVGQNCKQISHLDIAGSQTVTDQVLTAFQFHFRSVTFYYCSCSGSLLAVRLHRVDPLGSLPNLHFCRRLRTIATQSQRSSSSWTLRCLRPDSGVSCHLQPGSSQVGYSKLPFSGRQL